MLLRAVRSDRVISRFPFLGVFSRDTLPRQVPKDRFCFVFNTDVSSGVGEHWIAVLCSNGVCEFFDSYALSVDFYRVRTWFSRHGFSVVCNRVPVQSILGSSTCGYHCLYFLFHRCRGRSMRRITRFFNTDSTCSADSFVVGFVRRQFSI
jgi:hypothetical protein